MKGLSSLLEDAKRRARWEVVDVGLVGKGRRPPPEEGSSRGRSWRGVKDDLFWTKLRPGAIKIQ